MLSETVSQQISKEHIAVDLDYCFGKPRLVGTRMPVATIAKLHLEMEESLAAIASEYDLSLAAVYAAMAYYYDHCQEIDLGIWSRLMINPKTIGSISTRGLLPL